MIGETLRGAKGDTEEARDATGLLLTDVGRRSAAGSVWQWV